MEKTIVKKSTKAIVLKIGNDNGNSEHDIIINGKLIKQPNVLSKVSKLPNLDEVNKEYVLEHIEDNLICSCEGGIYYIGKHAMKAGKRIRSIEVGNDNNKIDSPIVLINTLAQIAGYAVVEHFKKVGSIDDDVIKVKADMGTSLPVSYYSHKNGMEFADKFLGKKHMVIVHVGNSEAKCEIEFTFVKAIPEGVTGTFALIEAEDQLFEEYNIKIEKYNATSEENNEPKIDKSFFEDKRVLHVAIGEGTTEYPLTIGIRFNPDFINGTHNGTGHAIDSVLEEFKSEKGLSKFSRQDFSNIIRDEGHKFHDYAMELVEQALEEEAEEILHNIKGEIQHANNEVDIVCVYGGGSILMREYIESELQKFCDRAEIKLLYVPSEYAVELEAKGLYNFTNSELFSALKEKHMTK